MAKWYSAGISNPSRDEGMGSNPGAVQKKKKKITGRHLGVMTWVWPGPLRVSEVQGRNTCYKGGFFSEDSLLSSSPMSFYLLLLGCIIVKFYNYPLKFPTKNFRVSGIKYEQKHFTPFDFSDRIQTLGIILMYFKIL